MHAMQLPDGTEIQVGPDRFKVPEVLFQPVWAFVEHSCACELLHKCCRAFKIFLIIAAAERTAHVPWPRAGEGLRWLRAQEPARCALRGSAWRRGTLLHMAAWRSKRPK